MIGTSSRSPSIEKSLIVTFSPTSASSSELSKSEISFKSISFSTSVPSVGTSNISVETVTVSLVLDGDGDGDSFLFLKGVGEGLLLGVLLGSLLGVGVALGVGLVVGVGEALGLELLDGVGQGVGVRVGVTDGEFEKPMPRLRSICSAIEPTLNPVCSSISSLDDSPSAQTDFSLSLPAFDSGSLSNFDASTIHKISNISTCRANCVFFNKSIIKIEETKPQVL